MGLYSKQGTKKWWMCFTLNGVQYDKSTAERVNENETLPCNI